MVLQMMQVGYVHQCQYNLFGPLLMRLVRLMVQGACSKSGFSSLPKPHYANGFDAFRKILSVDEISGLYWDFGISSITYAPSSAVWWGSYSVAYRLIWDEIGCYKCKFKNNAKNCENGTILEPNSVCLIVFKELASGISTLITIPHDTIKTRMQVLDGDYNGHGGRQPIMSQKIWDSLKEGGVRGFGKVFRGEGDGGSMKVAIKRANPMS